MRKEKISEIISDINSEYIEEAAVYSGKKNRQGHYAWLKWSVAAASIVLIVFLGTAILGGDIHRYLREWRYHKICKK